MKAPPDLLLGGRSPVVAYLSDSMMVCAHVSQETNERNELTYGLSRTVPADNERERGGEDNCLSFFGPKGADALDHHAIDFRHDGDGVQCTLSPGD